MCLDIPKNGRACDFADLKLERQPMAPDPPLIGPLGDSLILLPLCPRNELPRRFGLNYL
jgi:hypothetical protein